MFLLRSYTWLRILVDIVIRLFDRNMNSVQIVYLRHLITDLLISGAWVGVKQTIVQNNRWWAICETIALIERHFRSLFAVSSFASIQNKQSWERALGTLLSRCLSYLISQSFSIYVLRITCKILSSFLKILCNPSYNYGQGRIHFTI